MTPGTPSYMSPEQARGKDVDHRTDIYSLGVIAFEMVCGRLPYLGSEAVDILYQHMHATPPAPSTLRPDIPLQLERLILQMLDKKPERRPTIPVIEETLAELRDGTLAALGDTGPQGLRALEPESGKFRAMAPRPPHESTSDVEIPRKAPPRALVLVAIALAVLGLFGAIWKLTRPAPPDATTTTATMPAPAHAPAAATRPTTTDTPAAAAATNAAPSLVTPKPAKAPAPARAVAKANVPRHTAAHEEAVKPESSSKGSRDYMIDPFAPKK